MGFLRIEGLAREFPGVNGGPPTRALERTDLAVEDNDFITILGPSGCGKSTLLRIVAGLDEPSSGRVMLDGEPVTRAGPDRGMVFQSYTLFPWLTVRQNILFGSRATPGVADRLIARVGLRGFENHFPKMLSGGMQQRTALARALATDPKILPQTSLARSTTRRALMQELLLGIWEADRKTVLFVTHDIDEAIFMANRVAVLSARPGRIKAEARIDLPHPRHYTMKPSGEFSRYKAELTEQIRAESIKAAMQS
jgi:ABC-type nitrate/sulfonate/bicarbonate transport system ATPase subunit